MILLLGGKVQDLKGNQLSPIHEDKHSMVDTVSIESL